MDIRSMRSMERIVLWVLSLAPRDVRVSLAKAQVSYIEEVEVAMPLSRVDWITMSQTCRPQLASGDSKATELVF